MGVEGPVPGGARSVPEFQEPIVCQQPQILEGLEARTGQWLVLLEGYTGSILGFLTIA